MIRFRDILNENELLQLDLLLKAVNTHDKTTYSLPDDADLYWLYFDDENGCRSNEESSLTAIFCAYHMGDSRNGKEIDEVVCLTLPAFRMRGQFRALFECAQPLLRPCLRFHVQENAASRAFLTHIGAEFAYEEQFMERPLNTDIESGSPALSKTDPGLQKSAPEYSEAPLSSSPASDTLPVFEQDGEFIHVSCRSGECFLYPQGCRCYLFGVLIYKRFRGQGCGTRLLERVFQKLQNDGITSVYLEVSSANLPAVRLYQRLGFRITDRISCYYRS